MNSTLDQLPINIISNVLSKISANPEKESIPYRLRLARSSINHHKRKDGMIRSSQRKGEHYGAQKPANTVTALTSYFVCELVAKFSISSIQQDQ